MIGPLGIWEVLFILGLALLIFGPRKLPEIGRTLGKGMAEFRKASNELKRALNTEMIQEEIRQNDPRRILRDAVEAPVKDDLPATVPPEKAPSETATPETAAPETATSTAPSEDVAAAPAGADGTVARSSSSAPETPAASDGAASTESLPDTSPSPS